MALLKVGDSGGIVGLQGFRIRGPYQTTMGSTLDQPLVPEPRPSGNIDGASAPHGPCIMLLLTLGAAYWV